MFNETKEMLKQHDNSLEIFDEAGINYFYIN